MKVHTMTCYCDGRCFSGNCPYIKSAYEGGCQVRLKPQISGVISEQWNYSQFSPDKRWGVRPFPVTYKLTIFL